MAKSIMVMRFMIPAAKMKVARPGSVPLIETPPTPTAIEKMTPKINPQHLNIFSDFGNFYLDNIFINDTCQSLNLR